MRLSRIGAAVCAALAVVCLCSSQCSFLEFPSSSVTVLSYNLQTLFDDRDDGVEFSGWSVAKGQWDTAGYRLRLKNFAKAIQAAVPGGPDVIVLQEVENRRVTADLADLLPGSYPTRVASGDSGLAFRCAVLSKHPLLAARAHSVLVDPESQPDELRPLLEVALDVDGIRLTVLAAHWKSKLGGAQATEPQRRAQAAQASRRIAEILARDPDAEVFLAGDLNENPDEWTRTSGAYPTALLPMEAAAQAPEYADRLLISRAPEGTGVTAAGLALWSPWEEYGGYSYVYDRTEERIDNLLLAPGLLDDKGLSFQSFSAQAPRELLTESGLPWGWKTGDREGYSDHLPIYMELRRAGGS